MTDAGAAGDAGPTIDTADMQGLVARAYGHHRAARYLLLGITDPAAARRWLGSVVDDVSSAADRTDDDTTPCLNLAFTWAGLGVLGLAADALATFPRPLQEGMVTTHRSRVLGDDGPNKPSAWRWGGPTNPEIHVVVMLYAADETALDAEHARRRAGFSPGLEEVAAPVDGVVLDDRGTEHFGFADGLSQPVMKGWPRSTRSVHPAAAPPPPKWTEVNPGEVVLGYEDNFGKPTVGPTVAAATDPAGHLQRPAWAEHGRRHLGQGGTYVVFRQLAQDVAGFRRFVRSASEDGEQDPELVAAKMVGRWPNGAPLVLAPERDDQAPAGANDFGYHVDQDGLACPLGAHVRRSNPRDSSAPHPERARKSNRNHRILRRGRSYGRPLVDPPIRPGEDADAERGLVFICLNADIERQFEFVQHTWLGNPYFAGLYGEVDPVVGSRPDGGSFTWPADPVRRQVTGMPSFVTVKGGGYFFLPGISALRYLATLSPDA